MKNFLFLSVLFFSLTAEAQDSLSIQSNNSDLEKRLNELTDLYAALKDIIDENRSNSDGAFQAVNLKIEEIVKSTDSRYNSLNSRSENIENTLKISDEAKQTFLSNNVKRNKTIQENFYQYIKFYGDKYSQLDEKLTSDELAVEMRKIINPQTGTLGFKLSEKLQGIMNSRYSTMIEEIIEPKKQDIIKNKLNNTVEAVSSILENPIVNSVTGIIPFGSNIKNLVSMTSGMVVNLINPKDVKSGYESKLLEKLKLTQNDILDDLNEIVSFYDNMAKLDYEYQIKLQSIRTDVGILGIELKEFCASLETPLKKVDPSFGLNSKLTTRELTIQISNKVEQLKNSAEINKTHLATLSNMSLEIKNRSRDLYNRYREIQESKIIANNKFVDDFNQIILNFKIASNNTQTVKKLRDKNDELISKMNANHIIDKREFEKYLTKISELN